jgi:cell division protein FtsB
MSILTWILILTFAFCGYSTWYIVKNWARFKAIYQQLYEEKQAIARRYLKEKQGFDKI